MPSPDALATKAGLLATKTDLSAAVGEMKAGNLKWTFVMIAASTLINVATMVVLLGH